MGVNGLPGRPILDAELDRIEAHPRVDGLRPIEGTLQGETTAFELKIGDQWWSCYYVSVRVGWEARKIEAPP